MSERAFRAVLASVMVGFLVLAVVIAVISLAPDSPEPSPSPDVAISAEPSQSSTAAPTAVGPALEAVKVIGVGAVRRNTASARGLVLEFVESSVDAIPGEAGSFRVTLTDDAGDGSTVEFIGVPTVDAPGSLGAAASLTGPNELFVTVDSSDPLNVEVITIRGLGIRAAPTAAIGPLHASLGEFAESLARGTAGPLMVSVGSVSAGS